MRLIAVGFALAGCASEPREVRYNAGTACLYAERASVGTQVPQTFTPAASVIVSVTTSTGACDSDRRTECSVQREGATLRVSSVASWVPPDDSTLCTRDAVPLTATCATAQLDAGPYVVTFGDNAMVLDVPSTREPPCVFNVGSTESAARER
jgi:hypothetical protein